MSDYDMCEYVDDPCQVWVVEERTAAKPHSCCECGWRIISGERHEVVTSMYEGDWSRHRTCNACMRGPLAFVERNCGTARYIGGLFDHLADVAHMTKTPFAEGQVMRWIDQAQRRRHA